MTKNFSTKNKIFKYLFFHTSNSKVKNLQPPLSFNMLLSTFFSTTVKTFLYSRKPHKTSYRKFQNTQIRIKYDELTTYTYLPSTSTCLFSSEYFLFENYNTLYINWVKYILILKTKIKNFSRLSNRVSTCLNFQRRKKKDV